MHTRWSGGKIKFIFDSMRIDSMPADYLVPLSELLRGIYIEPELKE